MLHQSFRTLKISDKKIFWTLVFSDLLQNLYVRFFGFFFTINRTYFGSTFKNDFQLRSLRLTKTFFKIHNTTTTTKKSQDLKMRFIKNVSQFT